jgi:hypothetical protein
MKSIMRISFLLWILLIGCSQTNTNILDEIYIPLSHDEINNSCIKYIASENSLYLLAKSNKEIYRFKLNTESLDSIQLPFSISGFSVINDRLILDKQDPGRLYEYIPFTNNLDTIQIFEPENIDKTDYRYYFQLNSKYHSDVVILNKENLIIPLNTTNTFPDTEPTAHKQPIFYTDFKQSSKGTFSTIGLPQKLVIPDEYPKLLINCTLKDHLIYTFQGDNILYKTRNLSSVEQSRPKTKLKYRPISLGGDPIDYFTTSNYHVKLLGDNKNNLIYRISHIPYKNKSTEYSSYDLFNEPRSYSVTTFNSEMQEIEYNEYIDTDLNFQVSFIFDESIYVLTNKNHNTYKENSLVFKRLSK